MSEPVKKRILKRLAEKSMQERVINRVRQMSSKELFELMISAGIYTRDGELTSHYRG
jgi:hypothetical protein